ncbi:MAG: sugar ABC transporter substrate-binding protein [Chloroflexi bacterium]|nr:sugar ABC transporter substrate-binding protein [Chloroflexota bacterium]
MLPISPTRRRRVLHGGWGIGLVAGAAALGCGPAQPDAAPPVRSPTSQGVVLRFGSKDTAPDSLATLARLAAEDFEPAHPGARVEIEPLTGGYFQKLQAHLAAGTEPDTVRLDEYYLAFVVARDALRPLDAYASRDREFDSRALFPVTWQAGQYRGKSYGLTTGPNAYLIVYNKTAFEEAGLKPPRADYRDKTWTWNRLREDALRLTKRGATGQDTRFGFLWDVSLVSRLSSQIYANGGKLVDRLEDPHRSALDDRRTLALLQLYQDMRNRDRSVPMDDDIKGQGGGAQLVARGRLAMAVSLTNVGQTFRDVPFTWDFAPLPRPNGGGAAGTTIITNVYSMLKSTRHPELAWNWIRIMGGPKHARWHVENKEFLPAWKSLREDYLKLRPPEHRHVAFDLSEYGTPSITSTKYVEMQDVLIPGLAPVWDGAAPAKQVVDQLVPQVNELLRQA